MRDRVRDWLALVDACYPERHAEDWDAVGLHVGDPEDAVSAVLISLDVTAAVLEEATSRGAELVVAHHPLLFRPLERLTPATAPGRLALQAARARVAVAAAHTNLDVAAEGTSDPVVELLDLREVTPLRRLAEPPAGERVKLVTFVPRDRTDAVLDALAQAGAGVIGDYQHCSFRVAGTGTFLPAEAANPAVGERARLNAVAEDRLEVVVPRPRLAATIAALRRHHPYEEVAFDLYPLLEEPAGAKERPASLRADATTGGWGQQGAEERPASLRADATTGGWGQQGADEYGLGRVGRLPQPSTLREVAARIAGELPAPHARVAGDLDAAVVRVAVCGGAGESLIPAALAAGADVLVTGDLRHHVALDARTLGLALIDAGHHATEVAALPAFAARLRDAASRRGLSASVLASATGTDPWAAAPITRAAGPSPP